MFADGPGSRRFGRLGASPPVGRDASGKATAVPPTNPVPAGGSPTNPDRDARNRKHRNDSEPRFSLSEEMHQTLLQAVDPKSGQVLWQIPSSALSRLYREVRHAAAHPGPASFALGVTNTLAQAVGSDSGTARQLGRRAYTSEGIDLPEGGEFSRQV